MLKILALLTMTIDHYNDVILDHKYFLLTFIGRFAFPVFIYLSVKSYLFYTRSKKEYIKRILFFAFLSVPFYYMGFNRVYPLNILFTISFNLMFIYFAEKKEYYYLPLIFLLIGISDYSYISLAAYLSFYLVFNYTNKEDLIIYLFLLLVSLILLNPLYYAPIAILTFCIICIDLYFQNDFRVKINKYFFYIYYPLHIALLGLLK